MKNLFFLSLLLAFTMKLWAQTENPKQIISEVKQAEEQYIYADRTGESVEQALEQAQELLLREVMDYLKQSGENVDDAAAIVKDQMVTITVQRGDKFRAFVYIDKRQNKATEMVEVPKTAEMETIKPQEKFVETETTVMEAAEPMAEPVETEAVEAAEPVQPTDNANMTILQQIASMTTRLQVYDYITLLQKEGEKVTFSSHPDEEDLRSMYVLLYKRGGAIEAILTPPDAQGQRYNLVTGLPDAQTNHPATSVNGFTLK